MKKCFLKKMKFVVPKQDATHIGVHKHLFAPNTFLWPKRIKRVVKKQYPLASLTWIGGRVAEGLDHPPPKQYSSEKKHEECLSRDG